MMKPISRLSAAYLDGEISDEQLSDLCGRLGDEQASVDDFVLDCFIHNELAARLNADHIRKGVLSIIDVELSDATAGLNSRLTGDPSRSATPARHQPVPSELRWGNRFARKIAWAQHPGYFAAVVLAIGISGWLMLYAIISSRIANPVAGGPEVEASINDDGVVARLVRTNEPRWGAFVPDGNGMMAGRKLVLESGIAEIRFVTGAHVILEGPAEFVVAPEPATTALTDPKSHGSTEVSIPKFHNSGYLARGKLVARVSGKNALGFTIETPTTKVEDLGTEFAVEVTRDGDTHLHVYEGEVRVGGTQGLATRSVHAGGSLQVATDATGRITASLIDSLKDQFVRADAARDVRAIATPWQPDVVRRPKWDSHMNALKSEDVFSDADTLFMKYDEQNSSWDREAWLEFDLTGIELDRLIDAELVLTVTSGVGREDSPTTVPRWNFEVIGMGDDASGMVDQARVTWTTTRGATGTRVATFGIQNGSPIGKKVRAGGSELARYLRESKGRSVVLVVKRLTTSGDFVTGFASDEQGESGPVLRFRYSEEPAAKPFQ